MTEKNGLEYNTQRKPIIIAQYGRNIQKLVEYAITIEDREIRNAAAKEIIEAMLIINPEIKKIENYEKVLWDHLAIISEYKLDVDYPYPVIKKEKIESPPERVPYERTELKYKNYGRLIEGLIKKAVEMPDGEDKDDFIKLIALIMKKIHIEWFKEIVQDDVIFSQLIEISGGKLKIPEGFSLPNTNELKNMMRHNPQIINTSSSSSNKKRKHKK